MVRRIVLYKQWVLTGFILASVVEIGPIYLFHRFLSTNNGMLAFWALMWYILAACIPPVAVSFVVSGDRDKTFSHLVGFTLGLVATFLYITFAMRHLLFSQ